MRLGRRLSRAGKSTAVGLGAALISGAVLLGTLQFALAVPSEESLVPLARAGKLDYSAGPSGLFNSLRDAFVAHVLGLEPLPRAIGSAVGDSVTVATSTPVIPTLAAPIPGRLPRTVVQHTFDNDRFEEARPINAIPFTGKTDTRNAQRESSEPESCEPVGGTVWYRYRPERNVGLLANTFGTDHPMAIGVFSGQDLNDLTLIGCNVSSAGNAQFVFPAKKNLNYYFQLAAPVVGGNLVFNLDPLGSTRLVSYSRDGKRSGNVGSETASISADGRYVAFLSHATDLGPRDEKRTCPYRNENTWGCPDIYVRDMLTGRTELVSKNSRGVSSNSGASRSPAISRDGRYVVFHSIGDNLVPHDENKAGDIFVHDTVRHTTTRVSVSSNGDEGSNPWSSNPFCTSDRPRTVPHIDEGSREFCANTMSDFFPTGLSISSNGRWITFASSLHGLVDPEPPHCTDLTSHDYSGQHNHGPGIPLGVDVGQWACRQIYVHDQRTGTTRLLSVSPDGQPGDGDSAAPFLSRNGRWVVFSSSAANLVPGDDNQHRDVFVHNLRTGETRLASVDVWGRQEHAQSGGTEQRGHMSVSDDGRWVVFISHASNLAGTRAADSDYLYLKDMRSGQVTLITSVPEGPSASDLSAPMGGVHSVITADGRYIAFTQQIGNPRSDVAPRTDLYVYDRVTGTITLVSAATSGEPANGALSSEPEISADGHFVVFQSDATNLDPRYEDGNSGRDSGDVYIHELPWVQ